MAITTEADRDFDVQQLTETVQGRFAQKNAFMGSFLASQGAIVVNGQMPYGDPNFIGSEVTIPYFGTIGAFQNNPDGSAITPSKILQIHEKATIARSSLAFEVSHWAQHAGPTDRDPYEESADQTLVAAEREMDDRCIAAAMTTPLVHDVYSSSSPQTLNYDVVTDARSMWGDENRDIVGMIVHSRTMNDLRKLKNSFGNPLLVESMRDSELPRIAGIPLLESDKAPITGSTMGAVTSAGTTPPVATLSGTPLGAWDLRIECTLLGAHATATIRFSTDGGKTWSASIVTAAATVALPLIDTATDSLVGVNGKTGVSVAFAAGTFAVDNKWSAKASVKVRSLIVKRQSMVFWYNRAALGLATDVNVLAHTSIGAMHLYAAAHMYRRVPMGTKPGVVAIAHNLSGF